MRPNRACGAGEENGTAVVEFALVLPILLVLLIAMLDFGKAFNYWIDETQLSSAGARWAAVNRNPAATGTLQEYIQSQADTNELRGGGTSSVPNSVQVCITFPRGGTTAIGDPVKVEASVTYNWLPLLTSDLPLVGHALKASNITISDSATMRLEALPTNYSAGSGGTGSRPC
jgi:Flp pilus assembly protein TadG